MFQHIISLGSARKFYHFCGLLYFPCLLIGVLAITYGVIGGLFLAPADYQQGDAFRIIYVHVPCAMLSLLLYVVMAICSFIFLVWRIKVADLVAFAIAPIGTFFTLGALITGSIWGKPMWGTWWIWDARLTSELILLFLYFGYMALYHAIMLPQTAAKASALFALIGVIDIPIIHYSVYWWNTLHQGATITQWGRPKMESLMLYPLLSMVVGFSIYTVALCCVRIRTEIIRRNFEKRWVNALMLKPCKNSSLHSS